MDKVLMRMFQMSQLLWHTPEAIVDLVDPLQRGESCMPAFDWLHAIMHANDSHDYCMAMAMSTLRWDMT